MRAIQLCTLPPDSAPARQLILGLINQVSYLS